MLKIKTYALLLTMSLIFLVGCSDQLTESNEGKLNIVTTTGMISDVTKNIGGDKVSVIGLMGPGVDPHLYKASEGDVRKLSNTDLILYNGLHLEAKLGELFEQMGNKASPVTKNVDLNLLEKPLEFEGQYDPHVWFDVTIWMEVVRTIKDELIIHDPENMDLYEQNAEEFLIKLGNLHDYVEERASLVPKDQRVLITAHDAFNYFGKQYGFQVKGLQGISTASEAGTKDVQKLVDFIVDNKIKAIFIESSVPERNVKALQQASQARNWDVEIGGELFSDAMGDEGTFEGTYIGMVTHNIDVISEALR
ncbi:zinc ABC transporter substrate-binding protein [Candidatus Woesearchaeota archaeon]|nr:zinc ABC transporter substrate-binding protein [Candidatus Woesearchaeota archaeon]